MKHSPKKSKEGVALLVAMGILMVLPLIVIALGFDTKLEAKLISYKKKKIKAEMLAHSGMEYAKAVLANQSEASETEIEDLGEEDRDGFLRSALYVQRGLTTESTIQLGDGTFTIKIESAEAGRNVNLLTSDQWMEILEMANVPSTEWEEMIDCLADWIDEDDVHGINGAESDDSYYEDLGYPVKNGPLDSVEELLMVKGWDENVLYGSEADNESDTIYGIADILTVWGDGKVNINTASTNTMLSYLEYEEYELADVMDARAGEDEELGTLDDGIQSLAEVNADSSKFKLNSNYVKVTSIGDSFGTQYQITCIFLLGNQESVVVYWNEGPVN